MYEQDPSVIRSLVRLTSMRHSIILSLSNNNNNNNNTNQMVRLIDQYTHNPPLDQQEASLTHKINMREPHTPISSLSRVLWLLLLAASPSPASRSSLSSIIALIQ